MDIQEAALTLQAVISASNSTYQKYKDAEQALESVCRELSSARRDQMIAQNNLIQAAKVGVRNDGVAATMYRDSVMRTNDLVQKRREAQELSNESLLNSCASETKVMDAEGELLKAALGDLVAL